MTLYLDTSSLVKLYVAESGSEAVRSEVERAAVVSTSRVAYAEMRATLARLRRERLLAPAAFATAKRDFEAQWPAYLVVDVTDAVSRAAGDFAERYRLRGFDSLHLASYAEIARQAGVSDTHFSSFDDRLNAAAKLLATRLAREI